jgi:malic enzyme
MYFSAADVGQMHSMVYNWPREEVDVVVVTDGSRVLGLGDLSVNGMGISQGKLSLYTAAGGVHPARTLPAVIDVGTNNTMLRNSDMYLGLQQPRLSGAEYFEVVDEFMQAIQGRWPEALIQFEDFETDKALTLLELYRDRALVFNDDVQGTGATAVAGAMGAMRARGKPLSALGDERVLCVGAGSAGLGVATQIAKAMAALASPSGEDTSEWRRAASNFWLIDKHGLLCSTRTDLSQAQRPFARRDIDKPLDMHAVAELVQPTIVLGLSGRGGVFDERLLATVASSSPRPVIFPMSNPTSFSECTAEQAFRATDGRAIVATGSPFDSVTLDDGRVCHPSQSNNLYIFPGVGLGASAISATRITDAMLFSASVALAKCVPDELLEAGIVFPAISQVRDTVSVQVASAVARTAFQEGNTRLREPENIEAFIRDAQWVPEYSPLVVSDRPRISRQLNYRYKNGNYGNGRF